MQTHPEDLSTARSTAATDTGVVLQAGECRCAGFIISNIVGAAARYVKIYDKATAPTSSDTPLFTVSLAAAGAAGSTVPIEVPNAIRFTAGIAARCTTAGADSSTAGATSGDVSITALYRLRGIVP